VGIIRTVEILQSRNVIHHQSCWVVEGIVPRLHFSNVLVVRHHGILKRIVILREFGVDGSVRLLWVVPMLKPERVTDLMHQTG
jgi:hypothetical protein